MANIDFYASEITSLLRQVSINRNDIGMTQVNAIPIPEGDIECTSGSSAPITFTASGERTSGKVSIEISGESVMREHPSFVLGILTPLGRGEYDTGMIMPGVYVMSFTCSLTAAQLIEKLYNSNDDTGSTWITVRVFYPDSSTEENVTWTDTVVYLGQTKQITIPENFTEVRVYYDAFVNDNTAASGHFDDDVTFDIYPFLRLQMFEDEPFEPYKPDLQTQIDALVDRVTELEEHSGGGYNETQIERVTDNAGEVTQ